MGLLRSIERMLKTPFVGELDFMHLFLLVGLVLVSISAWLFILAHIRGAAMEIVE